MEKNRASSAMGGSKKKSKSKRASKKGSKRVHEMHVRHATNGGYIAKHDIKGADGAMENEEHQIPDMDALKQHMEDNMDQSAGQGLPAPAGGGNPMAAMGAQ